MADRLAAGIERSNSAHLAWPTGANELFVVLKKETAAKLQADGAVFYDWPVPHTLSDSISEDEGLYRLVTSFATTPDNIDQFLKAL